MNAVINKTSDYAMPRMLIGAQYPAALVELLDSAKRSVRVLMYDWQFYPRDPAHPVSLINSALIRAARRGVVVRALTNFETSAADLRNVGIEAKRLESLKLLHAKMVLVDDSRFISGSHNLSQNAMTLNCEVSTQCEDSQAGQTLAQYFDTLWQS